MVIKLIIWIFGLSYVSLRLFLKFYRRFNISRVEASIKPAFFPDNDGNGGGRVVKRVHYSRYKEFFDVLGRGFLFDPVMVYFCSDTAVRRRAAKKIFQWDFERRTKWECYEAHYAKSEALTDDEEDSGIIASLMLRMPHNHDESMLSAFYMGFKFILSGLVLKFERGDLMQNMQSENKKELMADTKGNYSYIYAIACDVPLQGKGWGSTLMTPLMRELDDRKIPCYLESTNPRNISFYERHGFKVLRTVMIPNSDVPLTLMRREPLFGRGSEGKKNI